MVTETDRSTYSLDLDTVQQLERLAAFWKTSRSGALRRAIQVAVQQAHSQRHAKLKALKQLQKRLALDAEGVAAWCRGATEERRHIDSPPMSRSNSLS